MTLKALENVSAKKKEEEEDWKVSQWERKPFSWFRYLNHHELGFKKMQAHTYHCFCT